MPTPTKGPRLGGSAAHERLIFANMSAQLFENKKITTTLTLLHPTGRQIRPVRVIHLGELPCLPLPRVRVSAAVQHMSD